MLKFQIFFGVLDIPDILFLAGRGATIDAGSKPTYGEKYGVPPLGAYVARKYQPPPSPHSVQYLVCSISLFR